MPPRVVPYAPAPHRPPEPRIAVNELTRAIVEAVNELDATQATRTDSVREQLKFVGEHILRAATVGSAPAPDGILEMRGVAPAADASPTTGSSRRDTSSR